MRQFLIWDNVNKTFKEEGVTWKDIDLSNFDIHDILQDRKPNTLLAIDENNTFTYIPINDIKRDTYNNVLGELTLDTGVASGQIVDVNHYKDLFGLRQVDVLIINETSGTDDILQSYTPIQGTYQNPITLNPDDVIIFSYNLSTFGRDEFLFTTDNTNVTYNIYFTYDNVQYFTIDDTGKIIFVNDITSDAGMSFDSLNTNISNIAKGYDSVSIVFRINNTTTETQTISTLQVSYSIKEYENVSTSNYIVDNVSSSLTRVTFNTTISQPVKIVVSAPLFKDTKDLTLNALETKTITYPIDLTSAIISVFELLSSTSSSTKTLRIEYDDPNLYIYDPNTTTIDGSVKFKTLYTKNNVPYVTDKPIVVISTGYYDLHFLTALNSITVLYDDKNNAIKASLALTFDDGNTWIGWDHSNNTFITFTDVNETLLKGIPLEELPNVPISDLTNQYGKLFNIAISFKTYDGNNSDTISFNNQFTTSSQNVRLDLDGNIVHKLPVPEVYGSLIHVTNPNNYPVYNYPVFVDLSPIPIRPLFFEIVDTDDNSLVYYYYAKTNFQYISSGGNYIVLVIPYIGPNETKTYKMVSTLTNKSVHPRYLLEYFFDPSMGSVWQYTGPQYTTTTDGFVFSVSGTSGNYYLAQTPEDIWGKDLIVYWKANPDANWWYSNHVYAQTTDYKYPRISHYSGGRIYAYNGQSSANFYVDTTTHLQEKVSIKFKTPEHIILEVDDRNGNIYTLDQPLTGYSVPRGSGVYPRIYLYSPSTSNPVGCIVETVFLKPSVDSELQVQVEYVRYPAPENLTLTFDNPVDIAYLEHVDEYWLKLDFDYVEAFIFGWQVSPDGNTWYYYDPFTRSFKVPGLELDVSVIAPNAGIPVHTYINQFGTSTMYIRLTGSVYEFKLRPNLIFYGFPEDNSFVIDDILVNYNVNAHYELATDVYIAIQNTNTLVIKNETGDIKQLKVNIVG